MSHTAVETESKKLPLHELHEARGGRFGAFGEWTIPLYYTSVLEEHETVRNGAGVFDISHMGEFYLEGADAAANLNCWITNDLRKLSTGRALYSPVCRESGGIVDDVIVYEFSPERYLIVVNAGNVEKDFAWFGEHLSGKAELTNRSDETLLFAVQGPKSPEVIEKLLGVPPQSLSFYRFIELDSNFGRLIIAETGYTGEKGYEIFLPPEHGRRFWEALFESGHPLGLKPIGFGARDTLRLEARLLLYGHDMNDETTPLEAGLGWTVGWEKESFIGKDSLLRQRAEGVRKKLAGFELKDRGIAREGAEIFVEGRKAGRVTSGTFSPTFKKSIGLGYAASEYANAGREIEIEIRGRKIKAEIVKTPFYKKAS